MYAHTRRCARPLLTFSCSLHQVHDESKDKLYEFEVSWICKQSNYQHEFVPADLLAEATRLAEEELNPPDEME